MKKLMGKMNNKKMRLKQNKKKNFIKIINSRKNQSKKIKILSDFLNV